MPKDGLPLNEVLVEMLTFEVTKVSRGKAFDMLQEKLKHI